MYMEEIKQKIKEHRKITDSSLHIYTRNVGKLAQSITGKAYENSEFLLNVEQVLEQINDKSLSTKKNYLSSVLVFLNPTGIKDYSEDLSKVIAKYNKLLKDYHNEYMKKMAEQKKSAQQSDNWVSLDTLVRINVKYKNKVRRLGISLGSTAVRDKERLDILQKYVVSSLYLFHPPRRCEYGDMDIISERDYKKLEWTKRDFKNYLVVGGRSAKKKFFSFGNYKTRNTMGLQKIPIKKNLNSVLNLWLKHNPSRHLLLDSRGNQMSRNVLSKYLYKVFDEAGVKISANMLRHIYLTEKYGNETTYKEKQDDAVAMAHSVQTQQQHYVKHD